MVTNNRKVFKQQKRLLFSGYPYPVKADGTKKQKKRNNL